MLFIIATNPAHGKESDLQQERLRKSQANNRNNGGHRSASGVPAPQKRVLEETATTNSSARLRTLPPEDDGRPSQRARDAFARESGLNFRVGADDNDAYNAGPEQSQPLFLASQLSRAEIEAIRESGLGIEDMDAEEFAAMLDGDGEEVSAGAVRGAQSTSSAGRTDNRTESGSRSTTDEMEYDEFVEDTELGPTQLEAGTTLSSEKVSLSYY